MKRKFFTGTLCLLMINLFAQTADTLQKYDINEVVVSATRMDVQMKNIPQKTEIIGEKEINSVSSENLADLLKKSTNLDIIQYPGLTSSIGIRGFSPSAHSRSYTLLLINGKPFGSTNMASVNLDNITRVEVIKGPYSILYGSDAMAGVINLITKKSAPGERGHVQISAGSFGGLNYGGNVNAILGKKTFLNLGFSRKEQNNDYRIGNHNLLPLSEKEELMLDKASYGNVMRNSKYQINHLSGNLSHTLNNTWKAGGEVLYTLANDVETPGNYWGSYGHGKKDIERINLYGNIEGKSDKQSFSFSPYYTHETNPHYTNQSDTGYISFRSTIKEYGFKMHDHLNFGKMNLLFGADLDIHDYHSERFDSAAVQTTPYQPDYMNKKAALFTRLDYTVGSLFVNGGLRYDYITYDVSENDSLHGTGGKESYHVITPAVGVLYGFPAQLKFHSSLGTAFSVPDAFKVAGDYAVSEYYAAWDFWRVKQYIGNPDLKPETSITFDAGLGYAASNGLMSMDITWFATRHKDKIIEYTTGGDTATFKNANKAEMNGFELMITSDLGALFSKKFKLEVYGNFTYMLNNKVEESFEDIAGHDSIANRHTLYTRKSNGNFGVYYDNFKGFAARLNARYIGNRLEKDNFSDLRTGISAEDYYTAGGYTADDMILKHPDYLVFDYSVFYTLQGNKRFGITISNVFNENYTEKDGYNMPGRMIKGSFSFTF